MERTRRPTIAGIFLIVAGIISLYPILGLIHLFTLEFVAKTWAWQLKFVFPLYILPIGCGIVAIIGGRAALRRRIWRLALAGATCGVTYHLYVLPVCIITHYINLSWAIVNGIPLILAILAAIFIAKSKGEFAHEKH